MQKIVTTGLKMDLHIHSVKSVSKDGRKVQNNTLQNIPVLIQKLNEQGVNVCAITDHDVFSYEMYTALKQAEGQENSIQKVLPGVEFSVCFAHEGSESVIHVVVIFSDEDDTKIRAIETIISANPPNYQQAYKEEDFLALLRKIDINTILIAHQKNTLTSEKTRKHDANTLGDVKFLEFVYTDYFEAYEFKNKRNEVLNKSFLVQNDLVDRVRFVTGTDCHDWSVYPSETPADIISEFPYTFIKCLPTFRGLVMAVTDHSRMKVVNSFFSATKYTLPSIKFQYKSQDYEIPLSKGINVIIGDNSVGKSLLLHAITGYCKPTKMLKKSVKEGYKKYLRELEWTVPKHISEHEIFCFDMQGEVRSKFEANEWSRTDFLAPYFPTPVDNTPYKTVLANEINRMAEYLRRKFEIDAKLNRLNTFVIEISEDNAESLTFVNNIVSGKKDSKSYLEICQQSETILAQIKAIKELALEEEDLVDVQNAESLFHRLKEKYEKKAYVIDNENNRMETVSSVLYKKAEAHSKSVSDAQQKRSAFTENATGLTRQLIELITASKELGTYVPFIDQIKIRANTNQVHDYEFVSKLATEEISTTYFMDLISRALKAGKTIDWDTVTEAQLKEMLPKYDDTAVIQFFTDRLLEMIEEDLQSRNSIIVKGMDKYAEMSSGLDSKIYFELLSFEAQKDGVYIIDQPEDNISQSAIREYLLDRFKTMGGNRQVIMVSHNPQFIVNLDVDNLIFLSKDDGILKVQSGALEYVCPEYNILDIVAKNIDGGLDTIKKRWKRYEKTAEI